MIFKITNTLGDAQTTQELELSVEEWEKLSKLLENPPAPTEALIQAIRKYSSAWR